MKPPLISCIVPAFNGECYLREALESIRAQTYRPLEIIVADDGSTDGTAEVVAGYGEQIRHLWQPHTGLPSTRNLGVSAARGEFVAFLDSDDLWHPEKLARQMARFQARPDLDLCVTHVQNFWVTELHEEEKRLRQHRLSRALPGYVLVSVLARRSLFDRVGRFNIALQHGDDTEWFLRAAEQGAVMELLSDVLVRRRLHRTNMSRLEASASQDALVRIVKASLDRRRRQAGLASPYQFPASDWQQKR